MAGILQLQGIAHDSRHPVEHTGAMDIDLLPISPAPQDSRITEELATEETLVASCGQPEGVSVHLRHGARDRHRYICPHGFDWKGTLR